MNILEAIELYANCPKNNCELCESCPLNNKRTIEDRPACSLLAEVENKLEVINAEKS